MKRKKRRMKRRRFVYVGVCLASCQVFEGRATRFTKQRCRSTCLTHKIRPVVNIKIAPTPEHPSVPASSEGRQALSYQHRAN